MSNQSWETITAGDDASLLTLRTVSLKWKYALCVFRCVPETAACAQSHAVPELRVRYVSIESYRR